MGYGNFLQLVILVIFHLLLRNEYFITVTPFGQRITSNFKYMYQEHRGCLISNEIPVSSALKANFDYQDGNLV